MGFLKRLAFYLGLVVGLVAVAVTGTVVLTYLFTGKLPSVKMSGEKAEVELMTPDEVVALIREQAAKAKAANQAKVTGGEDDAQA
jgi:hypothetical protein